MLSWCLVEIIPAKKTDEDILKTRLETIITALPKAARVDFTPRTVFDANMKETFIRTAVFFNDDLTKSTFQGSIQNLIESDSDFKSKCKIGSYYSSVEYASEDKQTFDITKKERFDKK